MRSETIPAQSTTASPATYLTKSSRGLFAKRVFDLTVAVFGLVITAPLFVVAAVLILLDGGRPIFFRLTRVGLHRRQFMMVKFRKMRNDLPAQGPMITSRYDRRLTTVGRVLERTKLDELPQLLNVLRGDMSIIGPRPEVPKFVAHFPEKWDLVLSVKPGIFGPAQLKERNESELYPVDVDDLEAFYVEKILPDKLDLDASYAAKSSFLTDLWLLARGFLVIPLGTITMRTVITRRMQIANFMILTLLGFGGAMAALYLTDQSLSSTPSVRMLILTGFAKPIWLLLLRVPKSLATSITPSDGQRLLSCALMSTAVTVFGVAIIGGPGIPWPALFLDLALFLGILFVYKLMLYNVYLVFRQEARSSQRRLIWSSMALAPLSVTIVLTVHYGASAWSGTEGALHLVMALMALFVRPMFSALLFRPLSSSAAPKWMLHDRANLVASTVAGSGIILLGTALIVPESVRLIDIVADAVMYAVLILASIATQNNRLREKRVEDPGARQTHDPSGILVVGSGVELSAYVASLDSVPQYTHKFVGIVTPHLAHRRSTVGGHRIVGEIAELTEILGTLVVDTLVVLESALTEETRSYVETVAARCGCQYFGTQVLPGFHLNNDSPTGVGLPPPAELDLRDHGPIVDVSEHSESEQLPAI